MEKVGHGNSKGGLQKVIPLVSDALPQGEHRADGVVLRRKEASPKSGERLIFLRGMGAVWAGAPGPGHRFGGAAEPMMWGSFLLYQGPRRLYLKGADVAEDFLSVRGSKPRLTCAARWFRELADRLPLGHENDGVLSLLWGCMKHLSRGASVPLLDARFAWRWGNVWGVAPSFDGCSECGAVFARGEPVFMTEWGFLCPRCGGAGYRKPVSPDAFEVLKTLCVSSADGFIRREPEARASCAPGGSMENWIKDAAAWLFSFLRIV